MSSSRILTVVEAAARRRTDRTTSSVCTGAASSRDGGKVCYRIADERLKQITIRVAAELADGWNLYAL